MYCTEIDIFSHGHDDAQGLNLLAAFAHKKGLLTLKQMILLALNFNSYGIEY